MNAKEARKLTEEYRTRLIFSEDVLKELRDRLNTYIEKDAEKGLNTLKLPIDEIIHETLTSLVYNNNQQDARNLSRLNNLERDNYTQKLIDNLKKDGYDVNTSIRGIFIRW